MGMSDIVIGLVMAVLIGGGIAWLMVKFKVMLIQHLQNRKSQKVFNGEIPNNLKVEGEVINVHEFIQKNADGEKMVVKFGKSSKNPVSA